MLKLKIWFIRKIMEAESTNLLLQYVISPAVGGMVLWLVWLTKTVMSNVTKIGINTALDEQTQDTLTEIKRDIKVLSDNMALVLAKLNG